MKTWRIDTAGQTLALASDGGIPAVTYWGPPLPASEDLAALATSADRDLTGGMLDQLAPISLCPTPRSGFQGQPGLVIADEAGSPLSPQFSFHAATQTPQGLRLECRDGGLALVHVIELLPGGMFSLQTQLTSDRPVRLHWLAAPVLPGPQSGCIIDVSGKWIGEFQLNRTPWTTGIRLREARTGRSGHEHPPYAILAEDGCTNGNGTAYGLHYGWSGGHRMVAEELPDGRRQIQFGHASGSETLPGTAFATAPLLATVSTTGLNGIATAFQADIRDRVVRWPNPARPRPVHYNCWEAVYFDHTLAALSDIADKAAALGAERFVLDDGWFGRRNDDTSSLGDWAIDRRKWPDGLHPLIAHIHSLGMSFGLWVEPEMVNPDSTLARAHPHWILGAPDQVTGRNQMLLDLSRADVRENLFQQLDAVLTEYPIDYLKWDHNRLYPLVDAAQTRGSYALLDRLRAAHPTVEIESCASGGGRIDAGILALTHRIWLSDSNDALTRLRIQHDAALFLPAAVTGSHVGPRHCHTSGRVLPMAFRAWVAAQRHMGFEMDLRELTEAESATLQRITSWWKANRAWTMAGHILRLDASDHAITAEMQLSADGSRFVLFAGQADTPTQILPRPLRLCALDRDTRYTLRLVNPEDLPRQSRGPNALKSGPLTLSGAALMAQGIQLPVAWPATMWVVEGQRLPD